MAILRFFVIYRNYCFAFAKVFPKTLQTECEQLGINFSEMATMAPVQIPFMSDDIGDTQIAKDASSKNLLTGCPHDSY